MSTSMPDGALPDSEPVRFDTKIAVLLRSDLEVWQRLNVTVYGPRNAVDKVTKGARMHP